MPASLIVATIFAVLCAIFYAVGVFQAGLDHNFQDFAGVLLLGFNFGAVLFLLFLLFATETKNAEKFGMVLREHIAAVLFAVLFDLLFTAYSLAQTFSKFF